MKLSAAVAIATVPWLRRDVWIPLASSVLIDVDHYLWYAVTHRDFSLRAAVHHFEQANPPQSAKTRLLHHPLALTGVLLLAATSRSRRLWLILAGLLFHVSLDLVHVSQTTGLKRTLSAAAQHTCPECGVRHTDLQLHTVRIEGNPFDLYKVHNSVVLCPQCHREAHGEE